MIPNFEELLTRNSRIAIPGRLVRTSRNEVKRDKDREVFERTLDVQLGAPLASSSIYLAYEHGRIGVVTVGLPPFSPLRVNLQTKADSSTFS